VVLHGTRVTLAEPASAAGAPSQGRAAAL
jgi:hypothetical protein